MEEGRVEEEKLSGMLTLYRRHLMGCPHAEKGRGFIKCNCPIWCDGELNGKRYRKSLGTRDWGRAGRIAERLERPNSDRSDLVPCAQPGCTTRVEAGRCERHRRTVAEAVTAFTGSTADLARGTNANYARVLKTFQGFATARRVDTIDQVTLALLEAFRASRQVTPRTWVKELGVLRTFLRYCMKHGWTFENVAKELPTPRNLAPADREPYTREEVIKILAACDGIGPSPYERLRARAMVLLLRYTALRISDVVLLSKDRIQNGRIYVRTTKNGKNVFLPVNPELQFALDALPMPRGASGPDCAYFFWSGNGSKGSMVRDGGRTLAAVFKASGVPGACAHRFRHTLVTEVLEIGGSIQEAADIIGDTEAIVRKHYAKWTVARQARIDDLMVRLWYTKKSGPEVTEDKGDRLVDLVRFELTTSSMPWKPDQSLADECTRNKRLARRRFGRHLDAVTSSMAFRTPPDSTGLRNRAEL